MPETTAKEIMFRMYELMGIKAKKQLHSEFGGDCLTDIFDVMDM